MKKTTRRLFPMSRFLSRWCFQSIWLAVTCLLIVDKNLAQTSSCERGVTELIAVAAPRFLAFPVDRTEYYPTNCRRQWRITTSHAWVEVFIIQTDMRGQRDSLTIYDEGTPPFSYSYSRSVIASVFGSSNNDTTVKSIGTSLLLDFNSYSYYRGRGFEIYYYNGEGNLCESNTMQLIAKGTPSLLAFPVDRSENYRPNCEHKWRITISNGWVELFPIKVDMDDASTWCQYSLDLLTIYSEDTGSNNVIAYLCGKLNYRYKERIIYSDTTVLLSFTSNAYREGKGFELYYLNGLGNLMRDGVIHLEAIDYDQYLTNSRPGYPDMSSEVRWIITKSGSAPTSIKRLKVFVVMMDFEDPFDCFNQSLTIYDGINAKAPVLKKLGGELERYNRVFVSSRPYLFLHYTSECSYSKPAFELVYSHATPEWTCDGDMNTTMELTATDVDQDLTSPNFPDRAPNGCTMQWLIFSSRDYVRFIVLDHNFNCSYSDPVNFYDGYEDDPENIIVALDCYSVYGNGIIFVSSSNYVLVTFTKESINDSPAFQIYFRAEDAGGRFSIPAVVCGALGAVCLVVIVWCVVTRMRKMRRKRQNPADVSMSQVHRNTPNAASGSQSTDVSVVHPSAPPLPPDDTFNYGYINQEAPPSYNEAIVQATNANAPPSYSDTILSNVTGVRPSTGGQTSPATSAGADISFEEGDDHVYQNGPALETNGENQETSFSQEANPGHLSPPAYKHSANDEQVPDHQEQLQNRES